MQTKEQFFKDYYDREERERKKKVEKQRNEIVEEISEWDFEKLKEEYIGERLAHISYYSPNVSGWTWDYFHDECRFCGLEYINGEHDNCGNNCWEDNKGKTLEDLEK